MTVQSVQIWRAAGLPIDWELWRDGMQQVKTELWRMKRILEISQKLTSSVSLKDLLHQIVDLAAELLDSEWASILLLDEPSGELRFVMSNHLTDQLVNIPVPLDHSIAGSVFSSGEPVVVADPHADPRYYREVERQLGFEGRSLLAVPLQFKDLRIGVLEAQSKRSGETFNEEDMALLVALAAQATIAIENARLYSQVQRHRDELEQQVQARTAELKQMVQRLANEVVERVRAETALRRHTVALTLLALVGQQLTATLDMQQLAMQLQHIGTEIVGAESASVWLRPPDREEWLVCWTVAHQDQACVQIDVPLRPGQGIAGWVMQTGESAVIHDVSEDDRFFSGVDEQIGFHTRSLLAVPLRVRDRIIGVLEMVNKIEGEFTTNDRVLAETLAASIAIAVDNARLVETLQQRTAELQTQNAELDAFAHTVAHDLKGPLSSVVGFAEVLEDGYAALPGETLRSNLHRIATGGHKMVNIVDELLLLSSVRKTAEIKTEALDMAAIATEAWQRVAHLAEKSQAELVMPDASTWPTALGYGPWVEEVWVNYLSNAIKYGGRPPRIEIGFDDADGGQVRFWVRDNGPGLSPEQQARLFTPFARLHQARARGHGLGLSIVQRIVDRLQGETGVESEPGQSSTFFFSLPAAAR
jgi:signal transduction histidine kinase